MSLCCSSFFEATPEEKIHSCGHCIEILKPKRAMPSWRLGSSGSRSLTLRRSATTGQWTWGGCHRSFSPCPDSLPINLRSSGFRRVKTLCWQHHPEQGLLVIKHFELQPSFLLAAEHSGAVLPCREVVRTSVHFSFPSHRSKQTQPHWPRQTCWLVRDFWKNSWTNWELVRGPAEHDCFEGGWWIDRFPAWGLNINQTWSTISELHMCLFGYWDVYLPNCASCGKNRVALAMLWRNRWIICHGCPGNPLARCPLYRIPPCADAPEIHRDGSDLIND